MRFLNHRFALLLTISLLCLPSIAGSAPGKKAANKNASSPIRIGIVERQVTLDVPDPKRPGKLLYHVAAAAAQGQSAENGYLGTMTQVLATLYKQGQPSATLAAPRAQGSNNVKKLVVTGTGGVVVHSLTQPGTMLTADTVVWYANSDQIVATGHVVYRDGKTGTVLHVPKLTADTKLRTLNTAGPGQASGRF